MPPLKAVHVLLVAVYVDVGAPEQEEPLLNAWRDGGGGEVEPPGQESWYALLLERPVSHVPDDEIVYDEVVQEESE